MLWNAIFKVFTAAIVHIDLLLLDREDGSRIVRRHIAIHPQDYTNPTQKNTSICLNALDCRLFSVAVLKQIFAIGVMEDAVILFVVLEMSA
jgi:hypothetical protein